MSFIGDFFVILTFMSPFYIRLVILYLYIIIQLAACNCNHFVSPDTFGVHFPSSHETIAPDEKKLRFSEQSADDK